MSANQVALWYLVACVCFIQALKGLSHPSTARRGNALGIAGMAIAVTSHVLHVRGRRLDPVELAVDPV